MKWFNWLLIAMTAGVFVTGCHHTRSHNSYRGGVGDGHHPTTGHHDDTYRRY